MNQNRVMGPYQLLEPLGQGGMGLVYRARHSVNGQVVALKTVRLENEGLLQSLRREIHALARIRHPGIVPIVDEGVEEGLPWYAMQLVEGVTLLRHVRRSAADTAQTRRTSIGMPDLSVATTPNEKASEGWWTSMLGRIEQHGAALPNAWNTATGTPEMTSFEETERAPSEVAGLGPGEPELPAWDGVGLARLLTPLRRLCSALAYLHGEGLVHCDLKPSNVIVRPDGRPVLMDFGLASRFGGELSRETLEFGALGAGTLTYMAPEQARGELVDARADLYSLGCVLYELLTGAPPFVSLKPLQLLQQHLHVQPLPPSRKVGGVPTQLDELVLRLLEKEPHRRFGHADDVAAALGRLGAEAEEDPDAPSPRAYLYRPRFTGRTESFAALVDSLESVEQSCGTVAFVVGESGVGKTRMVTELATTAQRRGFTVLVGQCEVAVGQEEGSAGGALLQALKKPLQRIADHCRAQGPQETERLLGSRGRVLTPYEPSLSMLPGQSSYPAPTELPPAEARLRLYSSLFEAFVAFSQIQPVLLLLDDLQWADELTLGFLRFTLDSPQFGQSALFVLGTCRAEEVGDVQRQLLESPLSRTLSLGRLNLSEADAIVRDMLALSASPQLFVRFLMQRSEGNPFFLAEYLRAALAERLLTRDPEGRWHVLEVRDEQATMTSYESLPLPHSLGRLIQRRLSQLSGVARQLLQAAAVLGREIEEAVLARMVGLEGTEVLEAMEELLARQLLEETESGRLRFIHDKIREAAYEQLEVQEQNLLHAAAARAIESQPEAMRRPADLGYHWERAGQPEPARNAYQTAARQAHARHALDEASRLYRAYLGLVSQPTPETIGMRIEFLRNVLTVQGRNDEALEHARRAQDEARQIGDLVLQGHSLRYLATQMMNQGQLKAGQEMLEQALELHRTAGNRLAQGHALDNLAVCYWLQGRTDVALTLGEQALELHREANNPDQEAHTLNNLAGFHWQAGHREQAQALCEQALQLYRQVGARRAEGEILSNLAGLYLEQGQPEKAAALFEQALARHREAEDRRAEPYTLQKMAKLRRQVWGDFEQADAWLDMAESICRKAGNQHLLTLCLRERGLNALAQGKPARTVLQQLEQVLDLSRLDLIGFHDQLRRAIEAAESGQPLLHGECAEDIPIDLRRWLVQSGRFSAQQAKLPND